MRERGGRALDSEKDSIFFLLLEIEELPEEDETLDAGEESHAGSFIVAGDGGEGCGGREAMEGDT